MKQRYLLTIIISTFIFTQTLCSQLTYTVYFHQATFHKKISLFYTNRIGEVAALVFKKRIFSNPSYRIKKIRLNEQSSYNLTNAKLPRQLFEEELLSTRNIDAIEFYHRALLS